MPAVTMSARRIEVLPPLLVSLLHDAGKLPAVPRLPDRSAFGFREPTFADMRVLSWAAQWEGHRVDEMGFRKVAGIAAFRDGYDFHTASDVREIVYLAGSPRAVVELVRWIRDRAMAENRRTIGSLDLSNMGLRKALGRIGSHETRIVVEAA